MLREVKRLFFGALVREGFACPVEVGYQLHDGQRYRATYICFMRRDVFEMSQPFDSLRYSFKQVQMSDIVVTTRDGDLSEIIKNRYTGKTFTFTTP